MTRQKAAASGVSPIGKSRMQNGSITLEGIDNRTRLGRRYRDILDALLAEYGCNSETETRLAREAARLSLLLEIEAAKTVRNEPTNVLASATLANSLRRILADLGVVSRRRQRKARRGLA